MLINSYIPEANLQAYRLVWINGRFGSGKTSIAYRFAAGYLERGYRLVTNNRCVWADSMEDVKLDKNGKLKVIIILDEGGLEFKANRQIETIAAYAAKMDVIYMIPSYFPPCRAAQVMTIQPVFNFKATGIPLIFYKWRVRIGGNFEDKGSFIWFNPKEIYGIYSRTDPGDRANKIVSWIVGRTEEFRKYWGYEDEVSTMEESGGEVEQFADSVEALQGVADQFSSLPKRRGRR